MTKRSKKFSQGSIVWLTLLGLICLGLLIAILLRGRDLTLLQSRGLIAHDQSKLMIFSVTVMLTLAIPTLLLFYAIAWKYRESNQKAVHEPTINHRKSFFVMFWLIPTCFVLVLVCSMWPAAHRLDQHRQIVSSTKPLTIQVVALRWKWLFIYPEQHIAAVNFVQVPVGTPVKFNLTADEAPMSSFWIPHWGGQLYAMTGHTNQLNLMADVQGDNSGRSAEINGAGFEGMKFTARATSKADFDQWVQVMQRSSYQLDNTAYINLLTPSANNPAAFYSLSETDLYDNVLAKYADSHHHIAGQE